MYCTSCGTLLGEETVFCSQCGKPTGAQPHSPPPPRASRRLVRVTSEKKIAGVCAGLARYFDVDVTLVRVLWAALAICTIFLGPVAYVVAWIVMPKESTLPGAGSDVAVAPQ
jgi:phage shock protein C